MANAKFEVYPDRGGHYRWRLVSSNGQTTATSGEGFSSHGSAKRAAEAVKEHAATTEVVQADEYRSNRLADGSGPVGARSAVPYPINPTRWARWTASARLRAWSLR